jgi:chromate transporter
MATADLQVSAPDLFLGFAQTGLRGFGGVLPWARRLVVEERAWLSPGEFTDVLSLCQFLPGPNIVNMSIVIGRRFQGARGAFAAACGLLLPPLVIVLLLAIVYQRFAALPAVVAAMHGLAAAAAGLTLATGLKMLVALRNPRIAWPLTALAFVTVGVLRWPLLPVLLILVPLGVVVLRTFQRAT